MADDDIVLTEYFKEVRVIDEATEKLDIIKELVENKDDDDPFYICDIGDIVQKYENLVLKMPRVVPFYAVKCNPDPTVLKAMAAMNASYDCASQREIASVMENGVTGDQIIFANTAKMNSHMIFAKRVGVEMLTVDGEPELHKIKSVFPEAKIVIRFRCDSASSGATFRTQSADPDAFARGIKICVGLIEYSRSLGFKDANLIDIGGGFPDEDGLVSIDKFAEVINKALENVDPSIKVISEPGRYVVTSAITLATFILGKNIAVDEENETRYTYYINDGLFNSFMTKMMQIQEFLPIPMTLFRESSTGDAKCSTIYGQTATKGDCVVEDCLLPELNVGEMLIWPKKGAYALAGVRKVFNIPRPIVFHYAKKSFWAQHKSVFQYNLKKKMIEC
ncbi:ornithine decarboxylase-like isoform X2 [Athalia rosae]|uniref:ornithine decarboxylase-like isoform X2 n=1 Tax=Athalia rosae TaxID=37344 RepID=UPI002033F684|nr:ornithine decarboxylase-like isoform X2 [Athalia rosae]